MSTGIGIAFKTSPFPVLDPEIIPDGSALLESLHNDGHKVGSEEVVNQVYYHVEFALRNEEIEHDDHTHADGVTKVRQNVINDSNCLLWLCLLVAIDEVDSHQEQASLDGHIKDQDGG